MRRADADRLRVRESQPAQTFFGSADIDCCLGLDRFGLAVPVEGSDSLLVMRSVA